jgi:hypothetical protein
MAFKVSRAVLSQPKELNKISKRSNIAYNLCSFSLLLLREMKREKKYHGTSVKEAAY